LAPAARAGDRIDFSAPAISLAIPQPEVEIQEPQKTITSISPASGPMDDVEMPPPQQITVAKQRTRVKDPWEANPLQDDADPRLAEDLFMGRPELNRLTNGNSLLMQHNREAGDSDPMLLRREDSKLEAGQNASKFGPQNGSEKDHGRDEDRFGRDGDRFGRDLAIQKNDTLLFKSFTRDQGVPDRFNAWGFARSADEPKTMTGLDADGRQNKLGLAAEAEHTLALPLSALPPGYGSYDPQDNRRSADQAVQNPGYARSWEPPVMHPLVAKSYSNPDQINTSRVVAPKRPVNLQIPKRPSDPNPF
jgi:hypothetical protein